jgi:hypothetical protein
MRREPNGQVSELNPADLSRSTVGLLQWSRDKRAVSAAFDSSKAWRALSRSGNE